MLRKPKAKLTAYNGQDIPVTAVCNLSCKHKDVTYNLEFYISNMKSEPVLSVSACRELGLIKFVNNLKEETADQFSARIQSEYKDIFEGLGCLERPYHIELKPDVQPVVSPPRRIPYGLEAVEKRNTGKLRICIDPCPLNKAIKREHYYLPTIEQITTWLSGAKYFSTRDARSGFWQIPLDEESSLLTTVSTVFGACRLGSTVLKKCSRSVP